MFVTAAYAQDAAAAGPSTIEALLPLVLIFVVFYFLLIRPQQKKQKQHRAMLGAVRRGDKVVTGGGILGAVTKVVDDHVVVVEIAEGIKVRVQRDLIADVLSKTEPASGAGKVSGSAGGKGDSGGGSLLKKLLGGKG